MLRIGQFNNLMVIKEVDFGFYLDSEDDQWGEILLPYDQAPKGCSAYDHLDVFIYFDSEDRIIATTKRPHAMVGQFNLLRVASMEKVGAFMDWGLPKDLLVPFGEQKIRLQASRSYIVYVFIDEGSGRIVGSTRINKFIGQVPADYEVGQMVELLIARETELGYTAIINDVHWGFLYHNEIFKDVRIGKKVRGYIQKMRDDGKIDLSLTSTGYEKVAGIAETILNQLARNNGFLPITAKTSPEELSDRFGVSKKNYKKALGTLYKKRLLSIDPDGIRLLPSPSAEGKPDDLQ
jgi:predicted RNA-binding protein (virulence factor B family)